MEPTDRDVDEYLAELRSERAVSLRAVDAVIAEALGGLERRLWEGVIWGGSEQQIIGYGDVTQPRPRGESVEWFLVGLAEQKRHLSIYVNALEGVGVPGAQLGREARHGQCQLGSHHVRIGG